MLIRSPRLTLTCPISLSAVLGLCTGLMWHQAAAAPPSPATPATAVEPTRTESATAVDPAALTQWIRDLDNGRFAVREAAQQRLLAAGAAALDAVGQAAAAGSLESTSRAVRVLLTWSESTDNALSMGALERLAKLAGRPSESAMAIEKLATVREQAAMESLSKLGARLEFDRISAVAGPVPSLQVIIGPKWKGGAEGLENIAAVRRASTVSFYSATIDGDSLVEQVSKLEQIHRVEFYGTTVSPEALERLKDAQPRLTVDVRGGARLGIAAGPSMPGGPAGAVIGEVQQGTAAEKAGLQPGDMITEFSGVAVTDFTTLTTEIAKAKAGDTVVLKVIRQSQPLGQPQAQVAPVEVTVKFEPWNDSQAVNPNAPSPMGAAANPFGRTPTGLPPGILINRR